MPEDCVLARVEVDGSVMKIIAEFNEKREKKISGVVDITIFNTPIFPRVVDITNECSGYNPSPVSHFSVH